MSWRDKLRNGSFRNVPFRARADNMAGGRRVALHEYPQRDTAWPEDLGLKARAYSITAYLIGDNFMAARDALIGALEKSGGGTLVHPKYGNIQAQVHTYRVSHSSTEGGMASIEIEFYPAGKQVYPAATVATQVITGQQADGVLSASQADFVNKFSVARQPGWVSDAATSVIHAISGKLTHSSNLMPTIPGEATAFIAGLNGLKTKGPGLLSHPASLASQITVMIRRLTALIGNPNIALPTFLQLSKTRLALAPVPSGTPARQQQATNQTALVSLVQRTALSEAARTSTSVTPASSQDALALRDQLASALDMAAINTTSDTTWQALTDLRVATIVDLTTRSAQLPKVATYTPGATLPALVIAQRLYGDASRADALVARNHVRNPGFVSGGVALEYLV